MKDSYRSILQNVPVCAMINNKKTESELQGDGRNTLWLLQIYAAGKDVSMSRRDKENYYLDIAQAVSERGTCLRRNFGAIIVKNDQILSTGYTGAPRGRKNCIDLGTCLRERMNIPRGERYELCRSVHAEMNAIIHAARADMIDSTLYLVGLEAADGTVAENARPCKICTRLIINAGIKTVKVLEPNEMVTVYEVADFISGDDIDLSGVQGY